MGPYDTLDPEGWKESGHVMYEELPPILWNKVNYLLFLWNRMKQYKIKYNMYLKIIPQRDKMVARRRPSMLQSDEKYEEK